MNLPIPEDEVQDLLLLSSSRRDAIRSGDWQRPDFFDDGEE